AQSPDNSETVLMLDYYDKTEFEENFLPAVSDKKGKYPSAENEIMLSKAALDALEIDKPSIGMDIPVKLGGEEEIFKLSGWFTDYGFTAGGFQGFISKDYSDNLGLTVEKDGILSMSAKTGAQAKLLEELNNSLTLKDGQTIDSSYDMQDESGSNAVIIVAVFALIGLIIVFSGYLLIYNVMYISVTKDIRFYGMLKTIGTSPKQIQKIVKKQAFRLSVIGIPIGIILGTIVSFAAVPFALSMFKGGMNSAMPDDISFNPFIYIATILFGIFTVAVSCRKPSKLAGKVSPVEALKYNGQNSNKIKPKKSTDGGKLYKMAYRNVFREKKRAILVFASLFMGTMAFLSTNAFIGSMKLENYVDYYLPDDFTIYTNSGGNETSPEQKKTYIDSANKLAKAIANINGVTDVCVNREADANIKFDENVFRPFIEAQASDESDINDTISYYKENPYAAPVIAVSKEMMEHYNKRARQKIDIERFEKGEICLIGYTHTEKQSEQMLGKTITLNDNNSNNSIDLEVGACPTRGETTGINIGYYWMMGGAPDCILISQTAMDRLTDSQDIDNII
ncbi:MAG: ABC transporter permease, partial [Oscillospiraceae bacterium]|nr:ABC transporter permease [Oscillospiraceae bacterium]